MSIQSSGSGDFAKVEQQLAEVKRQLAEAQQRGVAEAREYEKRLSRLQDEIDTRDALIEAVRAATEKDRRSQKLVMGMISHEVRSPVTALVSSADFLSHGLAGELTAEQKAWIAIILKNGRYALQMLDDMINFAALEAGRLPIEPVPFDLAAVVKEVLDTAENLPHKKDTVQLETRLAHDLPRLMGDPLRIRQVLLNLVTNALKFTLEGHVTIGALLAGDGRAQIWVADSGVGMTAEDAARVFT